MKSFLRMAGLPVGAFLLIGIVTGKAGWQAPRSGHLAVTTPPAVSAPESDVFTVELQARPSAPLVTAPIPVTSAELLDDLALDLRMARSARLAKPQPPAPPPFDASDLFIHLPPDAAQRQPLRVLVALHGMGGHGDKFAQNLVAAADRNGWVLIAPTIPYARDHKDPTLLAEDDLRSAQRLHTVLDGLPQRVGLKLRQHVLLYGFSRGAQLAHRFALLHPECVETVAAISAGTYTLPVTKTSDNSPQGLSFPYGVGDLQQRLGRPLDWERFKQVSFWLGVGEKDNRADDVSRAFDPYVGRTRIERARAFYGALQAIGVDSHFIVFPEADHEITSEMRNRALGFLRQDELADNLND
jgi:predicted esterase